MARFLSAAALVVAMSATAWSQEEVRFEDPKLDFEAADHNRLLLVPDFGLRAGYIKPRDADKGTWFGGVQVRIPLASSLALEGSIEFHSNDFEDGDIEVVQYPVQVTLLVFLFPEMPVCPYLLGGVGWYYTRVSFSGSFGGEDDITDHFFGGHLGAGVRLGMGGSAVLNLDIRYIFAEPNEEELEDEDFDSVQFVIALSFPF